MIFHKKNEKNTANLTMQNQTWMIRMVTSYSAFLLIILILFAYLYQITFKNLEKTYLSQQDASFSKDVKLFERDIYILDVYCRQLIQEKSFRNLSKYQERSESFMDLGLSIQTDFAVDIFPATLLPTQEVYCYLPNTDYIISPDYFTSSERYYKWMKRYDEENYEKWLEALSDSSRYYQYIPMDSFSPNTRNHYYLYMINLSDLFFIPTNAICCFVFDEEDLLSLFKSAKISNEEAVLLITDSNGSPILSLGEAKGLESTISALEYEDGYHAFTLQDEKISLGKYISESGLVYYYSFPSFESSVPVSAKRIMYLGIFFSIVLIGIIAIRYFSKRNVEPIIELGEELAVAVDAQSHLQEVVDSQKPIICNSYVRRLLSGSIVSEQEASYMKEYMDLTEAKILNSLYVCVYNNGSSPDSNTESTLSPVEFDAIITNALQEFIGKPLYYFSPADRSYAILLNSSEASDDFTFQIHQTVVKLHNYLLDTYGIWLFAGLGKSTNDIMNLWECYEQAVEAVSYASKNYFFFPYEFIKKDSKAFYYPSELSTKLIHFITTGNTAQTMELFSLIHQENIEERSLPIHILKYLLSDIRNTLLKAKFALPSSTPEEILAKLDAEFNQHVTFKLCEDIALDLCKLFSVETEDSNLISTIEQYIKDNYTDPSLGLNKISDEFQISESYFSHLFKEKTGINFSSYLEKLRMSEAARLIKETNISLNELYISVGYNNATSFRRVFKKIYGVTPSAMRTNGKDDK